MRIYMITYTVLAWTLRRMFVGLPIEGCDHPIMAILDGNSKLPAFQLHSL